MFSQMLWHIHSTHHQPFNNNHDVDMWNYFHNMVFIYQFHVIFLNIFKLYG